VRAKPLLFALALVGLASCGADWDDERVGEVRVEEDGRTLTVGWHCHPDASVKATEEGDEVTIELRVSGDYRGDCAEAEQVTLDEPLGARTIIDKTTGKALRRVSDGCYTASPAPMGCE
jgi:hypothetical protein